MDAITVFVDESGNHDLFTEKTGASSHFVLCAVVIKNSDISRVSTEVEKIRRTHFQNGEMKSSGVKNRDGHARRIKILVDILKVDFKFYLLAVDKKEIIKESGLQHKPVFYKFINGLLHRQLFQTHGEIEIIAEEHGDQDFSESFRNYINTHKPDLFWKSSIETVSSEKMY